MKNSGRKISGKKTEKKAEAPAGKNRSRGRGTKKAETILPYSNVYSEMGMMREDGEHKGKDRYSVAFRLLKASAADVQSMEPAGLRGAMADILGGFGKLRYQLLTVNRKMDTEDYLDSILLPHRNSRILDPTIDIYNDLVRENIPLGHNNMTRENYIVFTMEAWSPEEALAGFRKVEERAGRLFDAYCHMEIRCLTIGERLELIHHICCMGTETFESRAGMRAEAFDLEQMRYMKLTSKDLAAPRTISQSKTWLLLNGRVYARAFFISNFPSVLSGNLISELLGVSSRMVYSAIYEPLNSDFGFDFARRSVADNTVIRSRQDQSTLVDRKAGRVVTQQEMLAHTERDYFAGAALDVLTDAKSSGTGLFLCTFVMILYADSLNDLEQDTRLLTLSASRFAFQIRTLDHMQEEGLRSALPFAASRADVRRVFPVGRLCALNPFDVTGTLRENGLFIGMNSINDNLILMNRRNTFLPSGIIAGMRSCGKTWQVKREIWGSMISTKDLVFLISGRKEQRHYEAFIRGLGGKVFEEGRFNPLYRSEDYGVIEDGKLLKEDYLTALMAAALRDGKGDLRDEDELRREAGQLAGLGIRTMEKLEEFLYEHGADYPCMTEAASRLPETYLQGKEGRGGRLNYFVADDAASLLIVLDMIWNLGIANKKNNISAWIYIDAVDEILETPEGARYLEHLLRLSNILQNPLTLVIQNSALFAAGERRFSLQNILPQIGCCRLMSLGPVERKMYCEELNISPSLIPYVTNAGIGKGLIIDQTASLPFNDNCREICSESRRLRELLEPEDCELSAAVS